MASSKSPSDKFAFLLSGTINARFEKDLKLVFDTLTDYYGFPSDHIWISCGGALTTPGDFSGAHIKVLISSSDLAVEIASFCSAASALPSGTDKNTGVIYITGEAVSGTGEYKITNSGLVIASDWLAVGNFDQADSLRCEYIEVLQNSYSQDIVNNLTGMPQDACVIYSNPNNDEGHASSSGSYFTNSWVDGLRLIALPAGTPHVNYFADMLGASPEDNDLLVSMYESFLYAGESLTLGGHSVPVYEWANNNKSYFIGEPAFLIQDGDNMSVGWWESPDIVLTHPAIPGKTDDYYMADDPADVTGPWKNTINVIFRNTGTHPVRKYSLGIQVFRQPLGTSSPTLKLEGMDTGTVLRPVSLISYNTFNKSYQMLATWNTPFYSGITHECIRAKVQMPVNSVDFTWSVTANQNEAQRNLDPSTDPPRKGPDYVKGDMFRGGKVHSYSITNPFRKKHEFIITALPEYQKSLEEAEIEWYLRDEHGEWKRKDFEKLEQGFSCIRIELDSGKTIVFRVEAGLKSSGKGRKLRLPLEILVNMTEGSGPRIPQARIFHDRYAALAGITIVLNNEPADLYCKVVDRKGKSIAGAKIEMETSNRLVSESFLSDRSGGLVLSSINPDFYRIYAATSEGKSDTQVVELKSNKKIRVKLVISSVHKSFHKKAGSERR